MLEFRFYFVMELLLLLVCHGVRFYFAMVLICHSFNDVNFLWLNYFDFGKADFLLK